MAGPRDESPLCGPGSLPGTENIRLPTFPFPSPCELPSYPFKSQTTAINIFFCLWLWALVMLMSYSVFLGLSHVYVLLYFYFILFICLTSIYSSTTHKNLEGQREISSSCILATSHIFLSVFKILNEVFNNKLMAMNVINDFSHIYIRTYFFMFF